MTIARIALPVATAAAFDYWIPEGLAIGRGTLVRVHLAGRALAGVVIEVVATSDVPRERLRPVREVLHDIPALPADLLELAGFVSGYYQEPLGLVLAQVAPPLAARQPAAGPRRPATSLRFTVDGRIAVAASLARSPRVRALFDEWTAAPDSVLPIAALAALPPYLKNLIRRWRAAGWVEPAPPQVLPLHRSIRIRNAPSRRFWGRGARSRHSCSKA
jgi:primosomal protein N' (replication factor Y)